MTGKTWLAGAALSLGLLDLVAVNLWIWPEASAHADADSKPALIAAKPVSVRAANAPQAAAPRPPAPEPAATVHGSRALVKPSAPLPAHKKPAPVTDRAPHKQWRVLFATASAALSPAARATLDEVSSELVGTRSRLFIAGHADPRGTDDTNTRLGARRAEAVAAYLADRGVASERMTVTSFGEARPVAGGLTARALKLSRRVEISVAPRRQAHAGKEGP